MEVSLQQRGVHIPSGVPPTWQRTFKASRINPYSGFFRRPCGGAMVLRDAFECVTILVAVLLAHLITKGHWRVLQTYLKELRK